MTKKCIFYEPSILTAWPGIPTAVQTTESNLSKRSLVQACHCSPSSHTQGNIFKPPRVPRDAALDSRSQSRAMLDCVERKNAIPRFVAKKSNAVVQYIIHLQLQTRSCAFFPFMLLITIILFLLGRKK